MIRKILVVVNPMAYRHPCVEKAVRLASQSGATIALFTFDVESKLPNGWVGGDQSADTYRQLMRKRRLEEMEVIAESVRSSGISASVIPEWHALDGTGITGHITRCMPDLVIKDVSLRGTLTRSTGQRVGRALLKSVPTPVLHVRAAEWPAHPVVMNALSTDPLDEKQNALNIAVSECGRRIASCVGGEAVVAHPVRSVTAINLAAQQLGVNILAIGAFDRPSENGASTSQLLEDVNCDLLVVKQTLL